MRKKIIQYINEHVLGNKDARNAINRRTFKGNINQMLKQCLTYSYFLATDTYQKYTPEKPMEEFETGQEAQQDDLDPQEREEMNENPGENNEETEEASQNADDMGQTQNDERDNENIDPEFL